MDSERRIFPRRYLENFRQPPTLIGLTADDRRFSNESGLKRWGREDLRSGSGLLVRRRANLPDRSWFPSIVSRTFKNALPTGKTVSAGESEGARFLRRISWARTGGNGGTGLSTWFDFSEMRVLVFFVSRKYLTTRWELMI
jgi:hypothetical protein